MRFHLPLLLSTLIVCAPALARPAEPAKVRVRLDTSAGPIVVAVDTRHAPATSANFLAYVDDGRFDGVSFYRSSRSRKAPQHGFVQGGIRTDARRILPPFPLERTDKTGILHLDGTISMARRSDPNSAGGNFFITVGPIPAMDAKGSYAGYAAFGRVVSGMDTVKRILAMPTGGGMGGQLLMKEVRVNSARRLDGTPHPTGLVKPWLVKSTKAEPQRAAKAANNRR
ncbi:peptidyl-prolyl cis-trans isomerase A (cyclophilin A) [Sphingomonas gellani]|uniref:peptidylprolyl isomerase n=1 Tax=Sphingomonas gellani TaxID=1166340 RepID=A0A1H7YZI8_9SPHN|nr:peptidylprolyl isomerase [Sphingomonas gellani]SEM51590.1 peptidyl-prolyl cis-trans isomerase A (cyclophilin A) [Sphingomonas gellani]